MKLNDIAARRLDLTRRNNETRLIRAATVVARRLGLRSTPLLQLVVFSRLEGFVRHIVLERLDKEFPGGDLRPSPGMDPFIYHDFFKLAEHVGVVDPVDIANAYQQAGLPAPAPYVLSPLYSDPTPQSRRARDAAAEDYSVICDLVRRHQSGSAPSLNRPDVRYLVVLCAYILELESMSFEHEIAPSMEEKFYSDLGELAYELYIRPHFEKLCTRLAPRRVLDVGCGEGRHLETILANGPVEHAVGIERQVDVADNARQRLATTKTVTIETTTFGEYQTDERFDLVLSSFMLFYMTSEERVELFRQVREVLADGGTFVIVQYFPDIDPIQGAMVDAESKTPRIQSYLSSVGNVLVRAETLLNRTLSDFRSVMYWGQMREELRTAGLVVEELVRSDSLYYSYFILVRRDADAGEAPE